ncbi:hypothetical protein D3C85_376860 [compost metagenome]
MSRQRIMAFTCHGAACLLFPVVTTLGFQLYTVLFGAPFARGVAIGLAAQLIFIVFALTNGLIALVSGMKAKVALAVVLVVAVLVYLLPEHPLRALFFAGLSGGLSFSAIYASRRLAHTGKSA